MKQTIFLADVIDVINVARDQSMRVIICIAIVVGETIPRVYVDLFECINHPGILFEVLMLREIMCTSLYDAAHFRAIENNEHTCVDVFAKEEDGGGRVRQLHDIAHISNKEYGNVACIIKQTLQTFLENPNMSMLQEKEIPADIQQVIGRAIATLA